MTIQSSELKMYKAAVNNDQSTNGGRMSATQVASGVKNNLFPDVSQAQRAAGLIRLRKLFLKVASAANETLSNALVHGAAPSATDDHFTFCAATQRDVAGDLAGPRQFGAARPAADLAAGAASFDLNLEDPALAATFQTGDTLYVGDDQGGELQDNVTVAVNGSTATITLDAGAQLAATYTLARNAVAAAVLDLGDIAATADGFSVNAGAGGYDDSAHPPEPDAIGGVEQDWTLTFTSATDFDLAGDTLGQVASGEVGADFAPQNPDQAAPYFTLRAAGWSGVFSQGDTVTFSTHPAAAAVWITQTVPAGSAAGVSEFGLHFGGESA